MADQKHGDVTMDTTSREGPSDSGVPTTTQRDATLPAAGTRAAQLGVAGTIQLPPARRPATLDSGARDQGDAALVAFQPTMHAGPSTPAPPYTSWPSIPSDRSSFWQGRISVGNEIGRGGMGFVLKGVDADLRRELAIKVAANGAEGSQSDLVRFVEEAQVTAQLEHPNVVPVHELGIDPDGRAFFTMKLVRGDSLENILRKRAERDPDTVARWGLRRLLDVYYLSVCQAIEYAHARGVIHRDLKPANIMVGDYGEVLVMDWGVAKVKRRPAAPQVVPAAAPEVSTVRTEGDAHQTLSGTVLGTPAYMSPEQARGDVTLVDERTDIYALGAILYELLCGQAPFDGPTPIAVLSK